MSRFDLEYDGLLWFAIAIPLIALWVAALWDLFRRQDLSARRKAAWTAVIIVTAYIGIAIYFALRPIPDPPGKSSTQTVPRASALVTQLEDLVRRNANGEMSEAEFTTAKRHLLGLDV
ncbi:MAG: PLD nuclease N-terminal domain-containing protein [Acidimicrobiia bacterium]|nr:PLD nuclease N-terminal domain-containing protein [Acidimicrobiia bacterium]